VSSVLAALLLPAGAGAAAAPHDGSLLYLRPLGGNAPPHGRLFVANADGSGAPG
jgi:hypothetical protein